MFDPIHVGFYVTVIRAKRAGYLSGPFSSYDLANEMLPSVRERAAAIDPFTAFDAFGVTKLTVKNNLPIGVLDR